MNKYRELRKSIISRDGGKCRYCAAVARSLDHIVPRAHGGTDQWDNLVASCLRCNSIAGKRLFSNFSEKREYIINRGPFVKSKNLDFGTKLRSFRAMKRLTIDDMAKSCGIAPKTMDRFMSGRNAPNAPALLRIMRTFEIHFVPEDFE